MAGFPLRHLLSFFGPKLRDARPIENPVLETGQHRLNLTESIAAASSLLLPRVSLIAEWNATFGKFTVFHQEEAWNAKHELPHPTLERLADGYYTYTFASSYPDNDGIQVPTVIYAARLTVIQEVNSGGAAPTYKHGTELSGSTGLSVQFFIKDESSALIDRRFWLEVF